VGIWLSPGMASNANRCRIGMSWAYRAIFKKAIFDIGPNIGMGNSTNSLGVLFYVAMLNVSLI
jgi:hypothetical protein